MRVLLAVASNRTRNELTRALAAKGQEVLTSASRGEELLLALERATPIHVACLSQAALGREWATLLLRLRKRLPGVRSVVVLRPGAEDQWRRAMVAGAFEALPASCDSGAVLQAVCCALTSTPAYPRAQLTARRDAPAAARRSNVPVETGNILDRRHAP